jgi:hypothetical protein
VHVRHCQQGRRLLPALLARQRLLRREQAGHVQHAAQRLAPRCLGAPLCIVLRLLGRLGLRRGRRRRRQRRHQVCAQRRASNAGPEAQARTQGVAVRVPQHAALPQHKV